MPAIMPAFTSVRNTCRVGQIATVAVSTIASMESHQLKERVTPERARIDVASGAARIQTPRE